MKKHKVRCYVMPVDGMYFAGCLTLNLTASGATAKEARKELEDVINLYLDAVFDGRTPEEIESFLNRPAPLYMYTDYAKCFIAPHVSPAIGAVKDFFTFEEVLPLSLCLAR